MECNEQLTCRCTFADVLDGREIVVVSCRSNNMVKWNLRNSLRYEQYANRLRLVEKQTQKGREQRALTVAETWVPRSAGYGDHERSIW